MPSNTELTSGELKSLKKLVSKYAETSASEAVKALVPDILSNVQAVAQARSARSGRQSSHPLSGEDLQEQLDKDRVEKAFRSVSRRVVAGTSYCLDGFPGKNAWVKDFKLLFEGYFEGYWDPHQAFPATRGRDFLAGLLTGMLEEQVSFEQVLEWFPTSGNHVCIHVDLVQKLRAKGIQHWPPHADQLPRCATYKLITCKRSHSESGLTDQPAVHPSTSASSLGYRAGPLPHSPSTLLPTNTRTLPSPYAPGAGHLCAESMPQLATQAFPVWPMNQPLSPGSRAGPSERAFPAGELLNGPMAEPMPAGDSMELLLCGSVAQPSHADTGARIVQHISGAGPSEQHGNISQPGNAFFGQGLPASPPTWAPFGPEDPLHQQPDVYRSCSASSITLAVGHPFFPTLFGQTPAAVAAASDIEATPPRLPAYLQPTAATAMFLPVPPVTFDSSGFEPSQFSSLDQLVWEVAVPYSSGSASIAPPDLLQSDASTSFEDCEGCLSVASLDPLDLLSKL